MIQKIRERTYSESSSGRRTCSPVPTSSTTRRLVAWRRCGAFPTRGSRRRRSRRPARPLRRRGLFPRLPNLLNGSIQCRICLHLGRLRHRRPYDLRIVLLPNYFSLVDFRRVSGNQLRGMFFRRPEQIASAFCSDIGMHESCFCNHHWHKTKGAIADPFLFSE